MQPAVLVNLVESGVADATRSFAPAGLHAASFLSNEHPTSLTAIAALAPNLRQLACRRLEISPAVPQAVTAADAGIYSAGSAGMTVTLPAAAAAAEVAVLPYVTHFGGQVVTVVGAGATAQAAAAFGKSFPHLQVRMSLALTGARLVHTDIGRLSCSNAVYCSIHRAKND